LGMLLLNAGLGGRGVWLCGLGVVDSG
jgi:hypothetical protein